MAAVPYGRLQTEISQSSTEKERKKIQHRAEALCCVVVYTYAVLCLAADVMQIMLRSARMMQACARGPDIVQLHAFSIGIQMPEACSPPL